MSTTLTRFYSNEIPDHRGRFLRTIQTWGPDRLESVHDYIQWLFPLPEPSPVNPEAPVLDNQTIAEFRASIELRDALLRSFRMMVEFYGWTVTDEPAIAKSPRFDQAAANWLHPNNHNHLRITRILRSVHLLGLEAYADAFFRALIALYHSPLGDEQITSTTFSYWQNAANSHL